MRLRERGALNYPPESLFSNVPLEHVEEALRHLDLPTSQVMTPYTCVYIDTGEHRLLVDTGADDLGAHAAQVFWVSPTRRPLRACCPKT
jgi:hypothetical protein